MRLLVFSALVWLDLLEAQQNPWIALGLAAVLSLLVWRFSSKLGFSRGEVLFLSGLHLALLARLPFGSLSLPIPKGFESLRAQLRSLCTGISRDAQALVLGITDGDDSGLSNSLVQQMKDLSLTHLTAVSGTNCSILIAATFGLLARCGFRTRGRVIGSLIALALYLGLVGDQPSVYRAAAMASLALLAMLSTSRVDPVAALAVSVLGLFLLDPTLVGNYGLALSALATAGLLINAPALHERLKRYLPKWLALSVSVTVSAQLFCLPVLAMLQPEQSSLSVIANIVVEPVVAIITLLGITATLVSLVSPALAHCLFWLASVPAQYIVGVVKWLSSIPAPVIQVGNYSFLAALVIIALVVALRSVAYRTIAFSALALLLVILSALQFSKVLNSGFPLRDWFYVSCDVGQGDATVIRSREQVAVIDVGREPKLINRCLSKLGISKVDLLVLTHFDADHVAGLEGALQGRRVGLALVTSYQDDRPGANWIETQLAANHIQFERVERGEKGQLGDIKWLILSPHHNGQDSEDPNDGSVTMLWQNQFVNIVTLADLGEKGQMRLGEELDSWDNPELHSRPTIVKVSHHGSADQFPELYEWLKPTIATVSVGAHNSYGHPTRATLSLLRATSTVTLRTDLLGNLSIALNANHGLIYSSG